MPQLKQKNATFFDLTVAFFAGIEMFICLRVKQLLRAVEALEAEAVELISEDSVKRFRLEVVRLVDANLGF